METTLQLETGTCRIRRMAILVPRETTAATVETMGAMMITSQIVDRHVLDFIA